MTIPGPSPASMVAGSCASERISTGVSPAVTQIGPRCTSPDLSFVSLILLDRIGIMPHHFIEVMVATLRLVWQGACGTAHARQRPFHAAGTRAPRCLNRSWQPVHGRLRCSPLASAFHLGDGVEPPTASACQGDGVELPPKATEW